MNNEEWTISSLKMLLDERYATQTKALDAAFKAAEQAVQTALVSAEKAVQKAETAAERRFEGVNEFRGQLQDQAGTFLTRVEFDAKVEALAAKIDDAAARLDQSQGRRDGIGVSITTVYMLIAAVAVVAGFFGSKI